MVNNFSQNNTPLETLKRDQTEQPKIIAIGANKKAIIQYFLAIEDFFVLLPTRNFIVALDFLFKTHFAFDMVFDSNLSSFWLYLQTKFYTIECKLSSKIIDVSSKISSLKDSYKLNE